MANVLAQRRRAIRTTIRSLLVEQVTHAVRWREWVVWMAAQGVTETWEIGAGKALSGMVRRIDRETSVTRAISGRGRCEGVPWTAWNLRRRYV